MRCDISRLNTKIAQIQADNPGMSKEDARESAIAFLIGIRSDEKIDFTPAESKELQDLWGKVTSSLTSAGLDVISEVGNLKGVLQKTLSKEEIDRLTVFFIEGGYDINEVINIEHENIQVIKSLIAAHERNGNELEVTKLRNALSKEEEALKKRQENRKHGEQTSIELTEKIAILELLQSVTELVVDMTLDEKIAELQQTLFRAIKQLQEDQLRIATANAELKALEEQRAKATTKEEKKKIDAFIVEHKKKNKELVKISKGFTARLEALKEQELAIKKLKEEKNLSKFVSNLEQEISNLQVSLIEKGAKSLTINYTVAARTAKQMVLQREKLETIAEAGRQARVEYLKNYASREGNIPIEMVIEAFGKYAVEASRKKDKDKDAIDIEDISKIWKGQVISTYKGGFFTADVGQMSSEAVAKLNNFILGKGIVDPTTPEAVDPTFEPSLEIEEAIAHPDAKPGVIPEKNKVNTHEELVRIVDSAIRRLRTVYGFNFFNGVIPEKVLLQVLDPKMMDIGPKAWAEARTTFAKPRKVSSMTQIEKGALGKTLLKAVSLDPDGLPEYTDPEFNTKFDKLITIDIEATGVVHANDNSKITSVYSFQIARREIDEKGNIILKAEIWMNVKGKGLVDILSLPESETLEREPLTKDHLDLVFKGLKQNQQDGFKVATYNGNNYDLAYLQPHVNDVDTLNQVALRSFDLLAHITSAIPADSWQNKSSVKGKKLKEIVLRNTTGEKKVFTRTAPPPYGGGRFVFDGGSVKDNEDGGKPIELDKDEGITPMWTIANSTKDWSRFDAYSLNDIYLTMDLFVGLTQKETTTLQINDTVIAEVRQPRSNLALNMTGDINESSPVESMGKLGERNEKINDILETTFYETELGYDADKVFDILTEWLLAGLKASPNKASQDRFNRIKEALKQRVGKETSYEAALMVKANEFQKGIKAQLEDKFKTYGFVLSLNYDNSGLNPDVVKITLPREGMPKGTFIEDRLYTRKTEDKFNAEIYVTHVLNSFIDFIQKPENRFKFASRLSERVKPRQRKEDETDHEYWNDVLTTFLYEHLDDFTSLADFGNAVLDWKPANEVGQALAQVIMDSKPGVRVVDVLVHRGESMEMIEIKSANENMANGKHRPKVYGMPSRNNVNMAQPHPLVEELIAYDGYKLRQRINWALSTTITPEIKAFLTERRRQLPHDQLSMFMKEMVLDISPDALQREVIARIPNLEERKTITLEAMLDVPRLLMSINHDCQYMGMNAPRRFLTRGAAGERPLFYAEDFINPGGATAAVTLSGGIQQLAFMVNFGLMNEETEEALLQAFDRGISQIRKSVKDGISPWDETNKADWKYMGKHTILAQLLAYRDGGTSDIMLAVLQALGVKDEMGNPITDPIKQKIIVGERELEDPRFKLFDSLIGNDGTPGYLYQLLDPNSPLGQKFDPTNSTIPSTVKNIIMKLNGAHGSNKDSIKEFLKGAITPAYYMAGYPGILTGLIGKNEKLAKAYRLTDEELRILASFITHSKMIAEGRIIDEAIGYSRSNVEELKKLLIKKARQQLTPENTPNPNIQPYLLEPQTKSESLTDLQQYLKAVINTISTRALPLGKTKDEFEKEIIERYSKRMEDAAEYWSSKVDFDRMKRDTEYYNDQIFHMNVLLAGGEDAAKRNLMVYGLARRGTTPYQAQPDVAEIHSAILGIPLNSDDYMGMLNNDIYFRYGIEPASGRNHMVRWWGIGPEGPKYAQPKVAQGKEENQLGMWDIKEDTKFEEDFEELFYKQVLLDLVKFYRPPVELGYDPETESVANFFQQVEKRSAMEIQAYEEAKFLELGPLDRSEKGKKITFSNGYTITLEELLEFRAKTAGNAANRLRFRTAIRDDITDAADVAVLNTKMPGFGALVPYYANFDFTQRGIYSLIRAQNSVNISSNRGLGILERAELRAEQAESDPNAIIPQENRGFVYRYSKDQMPMIPRSSEDTDGLIALNSGRDARKLRLANTLENTLVAFASAHGLDQLVLNKDWGRLALIKNIHDRALIPAARILRSISSTDSNTGEDSRKTKSAIIKFHDGLSKTLGITAASLSGKQRWSTIDLMISEEDTKITLEMIDDLRGRYGDNIIYGNLLNYLAHTGQVERLMGLKYGVTIYPGNVVRGLPGRADLPSTTGLPVINFGQEILVQYAEILGSEVGKKLVTNIVNKFEADGETFPSIIRDNAGYVIIESIDPLNHTQVWKEIVHKINVELTQAMAEIRSNFEFVYDSSSRITLKDKDGKILKEIDTEDNPLTYQGITSGQPFVYSQVTNPVTLHQFTLPLLNQLLNAIENYDFFRIVELGLSTNKEINVLQSSVDPLVREEQARLFERIRDNSDVESEALLILQDTNPPANENHALQVIVDERSKNFAGQPKRVVNFGAYYKSTDTVAILINGKLRPVPTADAVYVSKILSVAKKAKALNLLTVEKVGGKDVSRPVHEVLEEFIAAELNAEKSRPAHVQSLLGIKMLALSFEVSGNAFASKKVAAYLGLKDTKQANSLRKKVSKLVDLMVETTHATPQEKNPLLYKALAILERDKSLLVRSGNIDRRFVEEIVSDTKLNLDDIATEKDVYDIADRARIITETLPQVEEADIAEAANGENPTIFTDRESFINAFPNPNHKISAENIINLLDKMVDDGIISPWLRDMKLMVIGTVAVNQPDILDNFTLELQESTNTLMNASRKDGRFTIGLNFKALKVTAENQILFKFAEEILHIARLKYIQTDSAEWKRIKGIYESSRSTDMVRQVLMAMNNGKSYATLEQEVAYAKKNPDEFFAHMGAFLLLRQVLGAEAAIVSLNTKYAEVEDSFNLWKRAFYRIRYMTKRILTTFTHLEQSPEYSNLLKPIEEVVMSVIGTGAEPRVGPVANPDAVLNTYTQQTLIHGNKVIDPATRNRMRRLLQQAENPATPADTRQQLLDQVHELDTVTMFGISEAQVETTLMNLEGSLRSQQRIVTPKDIENQDVSKAILAKLFGNTLNVKGIRSDDLVTLGGVVRKFMPEAFISKFVQNTLLGTFNGLDLTWNSPYAPSAAMAFLIDHHAATTKGSFTPAVSGLTANASKPDENRIYFGGLEQQRFMVDPYAQHVNNTWGEFTAAFPHQPQVHLDVIRDVVQRLNAGVSPGPSALTDEKQKKYSDALTSTWFVFSKRARDLMVDAKFAEDPEVFDRFPVRLKDFSLLGPNESKEGFNSIRELVKQKNTRLINKMGIKAPISAIGLHAAGILPLELTKDDEKVLDRIQNEVKINGKLEYNFTPDPASNVAPARQHMIYTLFVQVSIKYQQKMSREFGRPYSETALADVDNTVANLNVVSDLINKEIRVMGYTLRNHTTSLDDAFDLVKQTNSKEAIINDYLTAISENRIVPESRASLQDTVQYQETFGFTSKATEYKKDTTTAKSVNDILAEQFTGELGKNSVLFRNDAWMPTSQDVYTSNDIVVQQVFETGLDTITKSFLRGTVYDSIERLIVNQMIGVEGVYLSFNQILNMLEEANKPGAGAGIHQISLLDTDGTKTLAENQSKYLTASIGRLRQGIAETRGTSGVNDSDWNQGLAWLNSAAKNAVVLRWGSNINVATTLVEGATTIMNTLSPQHPIRTIFDLFFLARDFSIQAIPGWAQDSVFAWFPSIRLANNRLEELKMFPLRRHARRDMARNSVFFLEESSSPLLPQNFNNADYSSALVEKMGWGSRFIETLRRANSNVMRSLRVANEAQANRHITRLVSDGSLGKLRDELNKNPNAPESVADIRKLFKNAGVVLNQEEAVYLVRSGLLEGRVVEVLNWMRQNRITYRGCIMFQDMFRIEQDLLTNPTASYPFNINDLRQAVASLSRFMGDYTQMAMVTRKSLDAPYINNLASDILTFYKSYPSLFVAQQLLRRGSIASPIKYAIHLMVNIAMDALYGAILAIARGAWELDELLEKAKQAQINYSEAIKLLMRNPVFQGNPLGFAANYAYKAVEGGIGNKAWNSVAEAALSGMFDDAAAFVKDISEPEATWSDLTRQAYLKFGGPLPGGLGAAHMRLAIVMAHDPGAVGRTNRGSGKSAISGAVSYFNSTGSEGQWRQFVREYTPAYRPPITGAEYQNAKSAVKEAVQRKIKDVPLLQPTQKQSQKEKLTVQPLGSTLPPEKPTKQPSLKQQGTTPYTPPDDMFDRLIDQ